MTKQEVITLRNTLKAGKNIPIQVFIDNAFICVDESNITQFTLWDDDNGLLFSFRLPTTEVEDYGTSNKAENVSVYAFNYDQIQGMAVNPLRLEDLPLMLNSISKIRPISDNMKDYMITTYNKILKENYAELTHEDWNKLYGSYLNTEEDYYKGKTAPNRGKQYANERSYYYKKPDPNADSSYKPTGKPTITDNEDK